uniref:Leucinerich repeatcontaining protein 40like [Metaseiulus occidentalis] n=1 Tax=Lepeophtheirus salmonis TaxID=72036 RepID=A0A0K2T2H8_LEPSM
MTGRGRGRSTTTSTNATNVKSNSLKGTSQFQKFRREQINRMKTESQGINKDSEKSSTLIKQARTKGVLNLSNKSLSSVPDTVWKINDPDQSRTKSISLSMDRVAESNWWDEVDITKLILASNKLTQISENISSLVSLQVIDLHDNLIVALPKEIGSLENLIKLNVNHNKIKDLPDDMQNLIKLKTFSAAHNSLKCLSSSIISRWESLDELDLSHNHLQNLTSDVGFLSQLTRLSLSYNQIREVPSELSFLRRLTMVELSHNQIQSVGDIFSESTCLEQLYLQNNEIKDFPLLNGKLKELHLGYNKIKEIPPEHLQKLQHLVFLDLKFNKVSAIPEEIASLQSLERLDFANNCLVDLPSVLGLLPNVMSIVFEGNPIKTIRRDILNRGANGLMKYLRSRMDPETVVIDSIRGKSPIKEHKVQPIIPDKYSIRKSRGICMSGANLSELPEEVILSGIEAKEIMIIDLSKNSFSLFPSNLEPILSKITELNLSQNRLESIPESLQTQAPNLEFINLSNNRLTTFNYYGNFLREINLTQNRFTAIPESMYSCPKLEILIISENKITEIDVDSLTKIKRLATLDLSYNDIKTVPPQLGNMKQIVHLQLSGNAFRVPRAELLAKGTQSVMAYLRSRIPA